MKTFRKSWRRILAPIAFMIGAAPAFAQGDGPETLRIHTYPGGSNIHAIVAQAKGFCTQRNIRCEVRNIASAPLVSQALMGKSIDIINTSIDLLVTNVSAGADLVIVATDLPSPIFAVTHRPDLPTPNKAQGYPAMVKDWKGLKVGIGARGGASEIIFSIMLKEAGLSPSDVTYVGLGAPQAHYAALVNRQIDVSVTFPPMQKYCELMKGCVVAIDTMKGEGPAVLKKLAGANFPYVVRRETVEQNPKLIKAYIEAMLEADAWIKDPKNFDELEAIYEPLMDFGAGVPDAKAMRRAILQYSVANRTNRLKTDRAAVQAAVDFAAANGLSRGPVDAKRLVWDQAP